MFVEGVSEQLLTIVHALLEGGMARGEHTELPGVLRKVACLLLVGCLEHRE